MRKQHEYKHLRGEIVTAIPMRELAERVVNLNYGVHQFLSHLVDVLRERTVRSKRVEFDPPSTDPLAEGIAELLDRGLS